MLVLTRKKGQSIIIGQSIEITIVDIQGDSIRLGVDAPKEISVHRKEVFIEIQDENKKAAEVKIVSLKSYLKNKDK